MRYRHGCHSLSSCIHGREGRAAITVNIKVTTITNPLVSRIISLTKSVFIMSGRISSSSPSRSGTSVVWKNGRRVLQFLNAVEHVVPQGVSCSANGADTHLEPLNLECTTWRNGQRTPRRGETSQRNCTRILLVRCRSPSGVH